jgi:MtN3 and saliva related transmembrane protein
MEPRGTPLILLGSRPDTPGLHGPDDLQLARTIAGFRRCSLDRFALVLGFVAGTASTFAFIPQVMKIWRERDCAAISLKMYVLRLLGFVLWLAYGFALGSVPLVTFNTLSLLLGGAILVFKLQSLGCFPDPKQRFCSREQVTS